SNQEFLCRQAVNHCLIREHGYIAGRAECTARVNARDFMKHVHVAVLILLLIVGCGRKNSGTGGKSDVSPLPEPPIKYEIEPGKQGGRLVMAVFGEPKTFNPITANESSSTDVIAALFAGLVGTDYKKFEQFPALAQSWSVADDKKTWTFKLRKGLRWSDGQPLTANDAT